MKYKVDGSLLYALENTLSKLKEDICRINDRQRVYDLEFLIEKLRSYLNE